MSSDAPHDTPDFSEIRQEVTAQVPPEYYDKYKQSVYMNLFTGSVYNEGLCYRSPKTRKPQNQLKFIPPSATQTLLVEG
jgi:hypothetical protein